MNTSHSHAEPKKDIVKIDYYQLNDICADTIQKHIKAGVDALNKQDIKSAKDAQEFVLKLLENEVVADMLIYLSRLPVFNKEFAEALSHNLDLLATAKQLKFFSNLSLGFNAQLLKNLAVYNSSPVEGI